MSNNDALFGAIAKAFDDGAAPGGAVVLFTPDIEQTVMFAHGHFAGINSPTASVETIYDIASITKLFTTALVLRLHTQDRLSVFDPCGEHLDNFRGSSLRIIDLLTHHVNFDVGMPLSAYSQQFADATAFRDALLQLTPPPKAAPDVHYLDLQFIYLGFLVERLSGHSLHDELHRLFDELGLQHTYTGVDVSREHLNTPPVEMLDGQVTQGVTHDEKARTLGGVAGHAGVFSTATDLARFGRAWLDGKVVGRKTLEQLVFKDYGGNQALGWRQHLATIEGTGMATPGVYMHIGFTGPFLGVCPETGRVAAFTCNRTYYGRDNWRQRVIWRLLAEWLQSPSAPRG